MTIIHVLYYILG